MFGQSQTAAPGQRVPLRETGELDDGNYRGLVVEDGFDPNGDVSLPSFSDYNEQKQGGPSRRQQRRARGTTAAAVEAPVAQLQIDQTAGLDQAEQPQVEKTAQEKFFDILAWDGLIDPNSREDTTGKRVVGEKYLEPYDWPDRVAGRGSRQEGQELYPLTYFQSGHTVLLLTLLLVVNFYDKGFPLTSLPEEYRDLIRQGFYINYAINFACAIWAYFIAEGKKEPGAFWFAKVFIYGGLSLGELQNDVPGDKVLPFQTRQPSR